MAQGEVTGTQADGYQDLFRSIELAFLVQGIVQSVLYGGKILLVILENIRVSHQHVVPVGEKSLNVFKGRIS